MGFSPQNDSLGFWILAICVCLFWIHHQKESGHRADFENIKALASVEPESMRVELVNRLSSEYLDKYPDRTERTAVKQWQAVARAEINRRSQEDLKRKAEQDRLRAEKAEKERQSKVTQTTAKRDNGELPIPGFTKVQSTKPKQPDRRQQEEAIRAKREQAAYNYARNIAELVGEAAGFRYNLNQTINEAQYYQSVARASRDWQEQRDATMKAEARVRSLPDIKQKYYDAENRLIQLYVRDGDRFRDAMRLLATTPENHWIVREYAGEFVNEHSQ